MFKKAEGTLDTQDWESKLNEYAGLLKLCFATRLFGPLHALHIRNAPAAVEVVATLSNSSIPSQEDGPSMNDLLQVTRDAIGTSKACWVKFLDGLYEDIHKISDDMDKLADAYKGDTTKAIDDSKERAKAVIRKFPEGDRKSAAVLWGNGLVALSALLQEHVGLLQKTHDGIIDKIMSGCLPRADAILHEGRAASDAASNIAEKWILYVYQKDDATNSERHRKSKISERSYASKGQPESRPLFLQKSAKGWKLFRVS